MNQISVFESSEITAFGIFTINLNLVMSVSMQFSNCVMIFNLLLIMCLSITLHSDNSDIK